MSQPTTRNPQAKAILVTWGLKSVARGKFWVSSGDEDIEDDDVSTELPPVRGMSPYFIGAAVTMELIFLALVFNHSILDSVGLDSAGPLDRLTIQKATLVSAVVLVVGFVGGFFLYSKMGSRVGGVIAIPLAALEGLSSPLLVPYIILGIGISYCIGELFFRKLLIYGRRLFYVYLAASVVVMAQLLVGYNLEPLSFSFIIPGIVAYNLHVDRDKKQSVVIAILYFAGLVLVGMAAIIVQRGL